MEAITIKQPVAVAVLAGGKSSRMGTDKAELVRDGETFLARTVRISRLVSAESVLVIGRDRPEGWGEDAVRFITDEAPGLGPVGGLQAALRAAEGTAILALSCDLAALTVEALRWLVEQERGEFGVVARNGDQLEPLFAIYTPSCAGALEANICAGKRSLHALIRAGGDGFAVADVPGAITPALENVNTPEQWSAFQKRLSRGL